MTAERERLVSSRLFSPPLPEAFTKLPSRGLLCDVYSCSSRWDSPKEEGLRSIAFVSRNEMPKNPKKYAMHPDLLKENAQDTGSVSNKERGVLMSCMAVVVWS